MNSTFYFSTYYQLLTSYNFQTLQTSNSSNSSNLLFPPTHSSLLTSHLSPLIPDLSLLTKKSPTNWLRILVPVSCFLLNGIFNKFDFLFYFFTFIFQSLNFPFHFFNQSTSLFRRRGEESDIVFIGGNFRF